jgi:hypothetical protein
MEIQQINLHFQQKLRKALFIWACSQRHRVHKFIHVAVNRGHKSIKLRVHEILNQKFTSHT